MSKYDLALIDCFNRVYAASVGNGSTNNYAREQAERAVEAFRQNFPRPALEYD